jgi:hypothetical protein
MRLWRKLPWFSRDAHPVAERADIFSGPVLQAKPEDVYRQLEQLIAQMPALESPVSREAKQWLRIVYGLVLSGGHTMQAAAFSMKANLLGSHVPDVGAKARHKLLPILSSVLAMEKVRANAFQGNFVSASSPFDARAAFSKVLPTANQDIMVIDPYLDEKVLTDFATLVLENVRVRLLAGEEQHKTALKPAAARWASQFPSVRPLEVRWAPQGLVHDRLIAIDGSETWSLTQSFNSFAARTPASIQRIEPKVAAVKVKAYENIWAASETLR